MTEYSLRIATDGTQIIISTVTANSTLTVYFQRLNIDAKSIAVQLVEITKRGTVLTPFPADAGVITDAQDKEIRQAVFDLLVK